MDSVRIEKYLKTDWNGVNAYAFLMKVKHVLPIYYVAVRGRDDVEGAVQRVLNKRRISSIRDFVLEGNTFFNTFILNWTEDKATINVSDDCIEIPMVSSAAQVIDGQHRLEGLKAAFEIDPQIGEREILVMLTCMITTKDAAKIFLNINTEQKPVPESLVYDLFGEIKDKESTVVRVTDIANRLNDDLDSPYYQCVKKPGAAQGVGKIDLSTIVKALKERIEDNGIFQQYGFFDFEIQYAIVCNYFSCLKIVYGKNGVWLNSRNPFMSNAGFYAGIRFLCDDLFIKCIERKSFEVDTMRQLMNIEDVDLIYKEDIKNLQGKEQRNEIYRFLKNAMLKDKPERNEYKF